MGGEFLEVLVSGVSLGSVYAMMAIGLTIVYGVSKIFNFAYGSFYVWATYLAWFLFTYVVKMNYLYAFIVVIPVVFVVGMITEKILIKPLRSKPNWDMTTVIVTLGLAMFMDNLALIVFGPRTKTLPLLFHSSVEIGTINIGTQKIAIFIFAVLIILSLKIFLDKTLTGMCIRAVAQDHTGAQIVGIPFKKVFAYTFGISTVMAGISGILLAPTYFISPRGGWNILVKAFVIVAFGGLGSIKGTLYAAFILGIVEALVAWHFGVTKVMFFWFFILLATLSVMGRTCYHLFLVTSNYQQNEYIDAFDGKHLLS